MIDIEKERERERERERVRGRERGGEGWREREGERTLLQAYKSMGSLKYVPTIMCGCGVSGYGTLSSKIL